MSNEISKVQKCLIIEWSKLDDDIREEIIGWYGFKNDVLLDVRTEFDIEAYKLGMKSVEDYWEDQKNTNDFVGTLDEFIIEYSLEFDVWFINQNFNLKGITRILVEISW